MWDMAITCDGGDSVHVDASCTRESCGVWTYARAHRKQFVTANAETIDANHR